MKKSAILIFLFAASLSAQVQLGKNVQVGGAGGSGGATFPNTVAPVVSLTSTTSRAATFSDIVNLFGSGTCSGVLKSDGTCITATGTVQAAPQFSLFIQPNSGSQAVAGPASTSQNAVTPILQGTANTDIFGNVSSTLSSPFCTAAGCLFERPFTSTDTSTIPNLLATSQTHGVDNRYGSLANWFYNVGHDASGSTDNETADYRGCFWNNTYSTFYGSRNCHMDTFIYAPQGGQYVIGTPSGAYNHYETMYAYERSISQERSGFLYCYKAGDCSSDYSYLHYRSGAIAANDEGVEHAFLHTIEDPAPYGTVTTGGANATTVKVNFTANAGNQADGLILTDTSQVMGTGYIGTETAPVGNAPYTFASVDINGNPVTHTVSSGIATLTAACGANTPRNAPASATCSVTINSGSFTAGGTNTVCVADWHNPEQAAITATGSGTLTLTLAYSHLSGTQIFQGGGCGGKLATGNGNTDPASLHQFTTYFIAGAPTTTSYAFVTAFLGGQDGPQGIPLITQAGKYLTFGGVSRTGNVVTAQYVFTGTPAYLANYTPPAGAFLQTSGFTPSDFNGTIATPITYNPQANTVTWNQTGPNESASVIGTIGWMGLNNYVIYCGAETVGVLGVTQDANGKPVLDGTLQLEANNCNWTPGDSAVQPNHYAAHALSTSEEIRGTTAPLGFVNPIHNVEISGQSNSGAMENNYLTSDTLSNYLGYGGTFLPHELFNDQNFYSPIFNFKYAPLNGGAVFQIGCPPEGCSAANYDNDLFNLGGANGVSRFYFKPSINRFGFSSPLEVDSYAGFQNAFGFMNNGGNITLPGTDGVGGYFSQVNGVNKNMNMGNGAIGDASGTLGLAELHAPVLYAGVPPPNPATITVTPIGATGSTTYTYACVNHSALGTTTGTTQTTSAGNATLSSSNYNQIRCAPAPGVMSIDFYRTVGGATQGKIGNLTAVAYFAAGGVGFNDTGLTGDATTPPTVDTSGAVHLGGSTLTGVQGSTGTKVFACTGTFTSGHLVSVDANGNCVDGGAAPTSIANVQVVLPTTAITANECYPLKANAMATVSMPGVVSTSVFSSAFASDPGSVTGYGASGGLTIALVPSPNTLNWRVCNATASSITPGPMTINVGAK